MRKIFAVLAIAVVATCAYAQVAIGDFEDAFKSFSTDLAGALAVDSTLGANWSDAYVGNFPHLGLGLTMGFTTVGADASKALFTSMNGEVPAGVDKMGLPIPVAVGTFKIGIPVLPMDFGFKLGFLPSSMAKSLMASSGSEFKYMNWGVQLRYALVKQRSWSLIPNVSVGLAYNHVDGSVTMPTGLGSTSYAFPTTPGGDTYAITASEPKVDLSWKSNTFDLTAQVSKKFIILVPYLGAGLTLGKSTVDGGVSSDLSATKNGGPVSISTLESTLASYGYSLPDSITSTGFSYTAAESSALLRLYGGLSFRLIIIDLDVQGLYLPKTKTLGASLTGRVQF